MGKRSIDKGKGWERTVARWLRVLTGVGARILDETREGNIGDAITTLTFASRRQVTLKIQAKHMGRPNPWQALKESDAYLRYPSDEVVVAAAVVKRDGGDTMVAMRPAVFAFLLAEALGNNPEEAVAKTWNVLTTRGERDCFVG